MVAVHLANTQSALGRWQESVVDDQAIFVIDLNLDRLVGRIDLPGVVEGVCFYASLGRVSFPFARITNGVELSLYRGVYFHKITLSIFH